MNTNHKIHIPRRHPCRRAARARIAAPWKTRPDQSGLWLWRDEPKARPKLVRVTEGGVSGRACPELRMGGSIHCAAAFAEWAGEWKPVKQANGGEKHRNAGSHAPQR